MRIQKIFRQIERGEIELTQRCSALTNFPYVRIMNSDSTPSITFTSRRISLIPSLSTIGTSLHNEGKKKRKRRKEKEEKEEKEKKKKRKRKEKEKEKEKKNKRKIKEK